MTYNFTGLLILLFRAERYLFDQFLIMILDWPKGRSYRNQTAHYQTSLIWYLLLKSAFLHETRSLVNKLCLINTLLFIISWLPMKFNFEFKTIGNKRSGCDVDFLLVKLKSSCRFSLRYSWFGRLIHFLFLHSFCLNFIFYQSAMKSNLVTGVL